MITFLIVAFEYMWRHRNQIWKGSKNQNWTEVSKLVNLATSKYWRATQQLRLDRKLNNPSSSQLCWKPPMPGMMKFNFDVAYKEGSTVAGVIMRNDNGTILGAWTSSSETPNAFGVETAAVIQALKIVEELGIEEAIFEGDAANIILALQGLDKFEV